MAKLRSDSSNLDDGMSFAKYPICCAEKSAPGGVGSKKEDVDA